MNARTMTVRLSPLAGTVLLALAVWTVVCSAAQQRQAALPALVVPVEGAIGPAVAEMVEQALASASADRFSCVVIRLNTPGGLDPAMRRIVQAIFSCPVPVLVHVAPPGARAASAGVIITLAADIAAMAPQTNIGAAHPVGAGGKEINKTMAEKVVNDMAAYVRGIARRRGRNEQWAEQAVRRSVSLTAQEALEKKVIDLVVADTDELLAAVDGLAIEGKGKLHTAGAQQVVFSESWRTRILKVISDPSVAYVLMMLGLAGIYFELSHPGAIFPGVVGAISLVLAFFGFQTLPVNVAGLLLIFLALVFFLLEIKVTSYGMLSLAGTVSLALGSVMLFRGAGPLFRPAWQVLGTTVVLVAGFFITVAALVAKAHLSRPRSGPEALLGEIGRVVEPIDGRESGKVQVHGELWRAQADAAIDKGARVKVTAVDGLTLTVEPAEATKHSA